MKPFRSERMAAEVATVLQRITGDKSEIVQHRSSDGRLYWRVVRIDPSGKEFKV